MPVEVAAPLATEVMQEKSGKKSKKRTELPLRILKINGLFGNRAKWMPVLVRGKGVNNNSEWCGGREAIYYSTS